MLRKIGIIVLILSVLFAIIGNFWKHDVLLDKINFFFIAIGIILVADWIKIKRN